jgi:hypothetical protein
MPWSVASVADSPQSGTGKPCMRKGRVKKFETEEIARLYLVRRDEAGRIVR